MFSRPVERVSGTQIFARLVGNDRQALVYSMTLATAEPVAMCLPLPVAPGCGEAAVQFIDLSRYADLFDDLAMAFPEPRSNNLMFAMARSQAATPKQLEVHRVGEFVASYVPTPRDFERLDPRFRLPAGALAAHAEYADWGFAVFQLAAPRAAVAPKRRWFWQNKPAAEAPGGDATIHPMAFTFPTRRPNALYFPTLHLHDGDRVPATARYDHTLYCQSADPVLTRTFAWRASDGRLGKHVDRRAGELVDPEAPAYRNRVVGEQPNLDHWFEPPRCAGEAALSAHEPMFAFELAATAAYYTDLASAQNQRWHRTARERLDELHAGLVTGLATTIAARAGAWGLVPLPPDHDGHTLFLSDDQPHAMTQQGPVAIAAGSGGTCVLAFGASTDHVERQNVRLAFAATPSRATVAEINAAVRTILERAISPATAA